MAISTASALRVQKTVVDAVAAYRAEKCAPQREGDAEYEECLDFMQRHCRPSKDRCATESLFESKTSCAEFFKPLCRRQIREDLASLLREEQEEQQEQQEQAEDSFQSRLEYASPDMVAFSIRNAGNSEVEGRYVVHGTHDGFTRYVQYPGGNHEVLHVLGFWLVHRKGSRDICYAAQSDDAKPPSVGWRQGPNSTCGKLPLPNVAYKLATGRPTSGDVVTIARAKVPEHEQYVGRTGVITADAHDDLPFKIESLDGRWFYEDEVVSGRRSQCRDFDGSWLNDMGDLDDTVVVKDGAVDDGNFQVADDCKSCTVMHDGREITGHISPSGREIQWSNGFEWLRCDEGGHSPCHHVTRTRGSLALMGPLPYEFDKVFVNVVTLAVKDIRPKDIRVDEIWRLEGDLFNVQFEAPQDAVAEILRQSMDPSSHLHDLLQRYLMAKPA